MEGFAPGPGLVLLNAAELGLGHLPFRSRGQAHGRAVPRVCRTSMYFVEVEARRLSAVLQAAQLVRARAGTDFRSPGSC